MRRKHGIYFYRVVFFFGTLVFSFQVVDIYAGSLACSITTAAGCTGTVMLRMASTTNAHAELPSQSDATYANSVVCCTGDAGLGNSCSGTEVTVLKLASTTNSHVQQNNQSGYTNNACMSTAPGGSVSVAYQSGNCTGYDTTMLSISSADNAHVGSSTAYTLKVCGTASDTPPVQSISFSLSSNVAYFGGISSVATRYASSTDESGSGSEVEAHSFSVSTNAASGYSVFVQGQTLTLLQNASNTINAIGAVNVAPAIGTEQFGLRVATTTGTGLVTSPYDGTGFAYAATATTTSQVSSGAGDSVMTTYSVRYIANASSLSDSGSYIASVVYIVTANF